MKNRTLLKLWLAGMVTLLANTSTVFSQSFDFTSTPVKTATENVPYSYVVQASGTGALTISAETIPAWTTFTAGTGETKQINNSPISGAGALAVDPTGNVYVSVYQGAGSIYKITPDGTTTVFAAKTKGVTSPGGLIHGGYFYQAYYGGPGAGIARYPLNSSPVIGTDIYTSTFAWGMVIKDGTMYFTTGNFNKLKKMNLSTLVVSDVANIDFCGGITVDNDGNLLITDIGYRKVVKYNFSTQAVTTLISDLPQYPSGILIADDGDILVSFSQNAPIRKYKSDWSAYTEVSGSSKAVYSMGKLPDGTPIFSDFQGTGLYTTASGSRLSGTPGPEHVGVHPVKLAVTNGSTTKYQEFNITVSDPNPPVAKTFSPANNTYQVPTSGTLSITFSENIKKGSGNIQIVNKSTNVAVETIAVTGSRVTIDGDKLSLTYEELRGVTDFYILIDAGAVTDIAGNDYAGISNNTTWKFTTEVESPGGVAGKLAMWLDASDPRADGTQYDDGTSITTWKDRSGQGNDARLETEQTAAVYTENQINGKPTLNFKRSSQHHGSFYNVEELDIRATATPEVTIFSVYRPNPIDNGLMGVWGNDNLDWDRFFLSNWEGTTGGASFGPGNPPVARVYESGLAGKTRLLTAVYSGKVTNGTNQGEKDASSIYFNGKVIARFTDQTHATDAQTSFKVGYDGDDNAFNGDIAEVIVYKRKLSDCEIYQINKYLGKKYGENFSTSDITISNGNNVICPNGSVTLTASGGESFVWFKNGSVIPGITTSTYEAKEAGDYQVAVTMAGGCVDTSAVTTLTAGTITEVKIMADGATEFCQGGSVKLTAPAGMESYSWYINGYPLHNYSQTIDADAAGKWTVDVVDTKGCSIKTTKENAIAITVNDNPDPSIHADGKTEFCEGGSVKLNATPNLASYTWFRNDVKIEGANTASYTAKLAGNYTLSVKSQKGCVSTGVSESELSTEVIVNKLPVATIKGNETLACKGSSKLTAPEDMISYAWYRNGSATSYKTREINVSEGGEYTVKVTDNNACVATTPAPFRLKLNPAEDCDEDGLPNSVECPLGYNCPDTDNNGTPDYLEKSNSNIMMPTLFTPNGDGINDIVRPAVPGIKTFHYLKIFNRWGNLVFETKSPDKGWDGTINGKAQPEDTYIWMSSGIDFRGVTVTQKGILSLVR